MHIWLVHFNTFQYFHIFLPFFLFSCSKYVKSDAWFFSFIWLILIFFNLRFLFTLKQDIRFRIYVQNFLKGKCLEELGIPKAKAIWLWVLIVIRNSMTLSVSVQIPGPFIKTISLRVDECFPLEVEEQCSRNNQLIEKVKSSK